MTAQARTRSVARLTAVPVTCRRCRRLRHRTTRTSTRDDDYASSTTVNDLTGMALVQRELGAEIIAEYED